jgi:hypothetical protein
MDFVLSIDTEADGQWTHGRPVSCANVAYWQPFQRLCAAHGVPPTYLVTSEMATDRRACELLSQWATDGVAEVGAHLHPWTTPPFGEAPGLRYNDAAHVFPCALPDDMFRAKLATLTTQIVDNVGVHPLSYRAGRYGMSAANARIAAELGYVVDSSVTPLLAWGERGASGKEKGPDFRRLPATPFIAVGSGDPGLVEIPVTIAITGQHVRRHPGLTGAYLSLPAKAARKVLCAGRREPQPCWLRPRPRMRAADLEVVWRTVEELDVPVAVMMFHSSELMPGGSPYRPTRRSVTRLLATLDEFIRFVDRVGGSPATLSAAARRLLTRASLERRSL